MTQSNPLPYDKIKYVLRNDPGMLYSGRQRRVRISIN